MSKVRILTSAGLGDSLQAFQCALFVKQLNNEVDIGIFARSEVFDPIKEIFKDQFPNIQQLPDAFVVDYQIEKNPKLWFQFSKGYNDTYFVLPDTLFRNPHSFNYKKYNTNPNLIKTTRLLTHKYKPEPIIYLGLLSTTNGYSYSYTPDLIEFLCRQLPNYKIYIPNDVIWDNKLVRFDIKSQHQNLIVDTNPTFLKSFEWLCRSEFGVFTDNGPSHLAYHLGMPRLILDPQYDKLPWIARWKEDPRESISISNSSIDVSKLIKVLLDIPATQLVPRQRILNLIISRFSMTNWGNELLFKF